MPKNNRRQRKEQYQQEANSKGNQFRNTVRNFSNYSQSYPHSITPLNRATTMFKREPRVFSPQDYYEYYDRAPKRDLQIRPQTSTQFDTFERSHQEESSISQQIFQQLNNHLSNNSNRQNYLRKYAQNSNQLDNDLAKNSRNIYKQSKDEKDAEQYISQDQPFSSPSDQEVSDSWESSQEHESATRLNTNLKGLRLVPSNFFEMGEMSIECDSPEIVKFRTHTKQYTPRKNIYNSTEYTQPEMELYYEN